MPLAPAERHLIALDLDGTVLHRDESIDHAVAESIRRLHDIGHEVVIATGRSVDATLPIVEKLRIRPEWVVCCNGAITLKRDPLADRAYRHEYVEAFDATEVLTKIRSHMISALYGLENVHGELLYTEEIPASTLPARRRKVPFEQLLGVQATRLLVVSPDHALEDFLAVVDQMGLTRVSYAIGFTAWLDIAPEGVSKEAPSRWCVRGSASTARRCSPRGMATTTSRCCAGRPGAATRSPWGRPSTRSRLRRAG